MAIAFVQETAATFAASASTRTLAYTSNVTAGNLLVVAVSTRLNTTVTVTDSLGNTYVQASTYVTNSSSAANVSIWYAANCLGGACTVSVTPGASARMGIAVHEYSGVQTSSPVGGTASATASNTHPAPGTVTVASAGDLVFAAWTQAANTGLSITVAGPFTSRAALTGSGPITISSADDVNAAGNEGPTWTISPSSPWAALGVSFKQALVATVWWPLAVRQMQGPPDPAPWATLAPNHVGGWLWTNGVTIPNPDLTWFPKAIRTYPSPPEREPTPTLAPNPIAGWKFTNGVPSSSVDLTWFPRAIRQAAARLDPEPWQARRSAGGAFSDWWPRLLPGVTALSAFRVSVDPSAPIRTRRHLQEVALILNCLLDGGYITMPAPGCFAILAAAVPADGDKGDITVSGSGLIWTIDDGAVTYAKLQTVSATARILARKSPGAGAAEECTLSEILDFISSAAQGDILYRSASGWVRLPAGTSGQLLMTQGVGADLLWNDSGVSFVQVAP